jgi:two-component system, NarL family, nitrate/nitrite response regulator NarL
VADLRLLIVADDPLARAGLATILAEQPGCSVVGQIGGEPDVVADLDLYQPDVVVWDLGWDPAQTNLESLGELREAGTPVVVLLPDEAWAASAWAAGPQALLLRDAGVERIQAAIQAAAQDLASFDPVLVAGLLPARQPQDLTLVEPLTPREVEVLQQLAEGLSNKAIANQLGVSEHTVKFHVNAILGKLNAQSRTDAVVRATRLGLILL